jgi:hypothetical protein
VRLNQLSYVIVFGDDKTDILFWRTSSKKSAGNFTIYQSRKNR